MLLYLNRSGYLLPRLLLALSLSLMVHHSVAGQPQSSPEIFVNGTLSLASAFSMDGAPEVHQMIRGDSHFDNLRFRIFGDIVFNDRLTLFNQFMIDPSINFGLETFLRTYLRFSIFQTDTADLSVQAGKLPTVFGSLGERAYSEHNPLISNPLMYHYFTSLRSNQLPAGNADLLSQRGNGLGSEFGGFEGGGSPAAFSGLSIIYDPGWDTGIEAIGSWGRFEYLVAMTQGTLSAPRFRGGDNNSGKQVAFHVDYVVAPSLMVGASFARGPYLDPVVESGLSEGERAEDFNQSIFGFNTEYGIGHFELHAEFAANRWESPNITDEAGQRMDLDNHVWYIEGKYTLAPGFYAALRYDEIRFAEIPDPETNRRIPWDYNIRTFEWGIGYYLTDKVIGKLIRKDIRTSEPGLSSKFFLAAQLSASF